MLGIALTLPSRRRCPARHRVLWPSLAFWPDACAGSREPSRDWLRDRPVRFPHLVEICGPPLQAGLSELIPIGGGPSGHELSALLGRSVRHYSSRRLLTVLRPCADSTGSWRAAIWQSPYRACNP